VKKVKTNAEESLLEKTNEMELLEKQFLLLNEQNLKDAENFKTMSITLNEDISKYKKLFENEISSNNRLSEKLENVTSQKNKLERQASEDKNNLEGNISDLKKLHNIASEEQKSKIDKLTEEIEESKILLETEKKNNKKLAVTLDSLRSKELEQADEVEELYVQLNEFKAEEKLYKLENIALRQQLEDRKQTGCFSIRRLFRRR